MDVTVVVATYGGEEWERLARTRAVPSAVSQAPVVHVHGETLAEARNAALERVTSEFVVHLDADDELEPGYIDAMAGGGCDLRGPSVRYVKHGKPRQIGVPRVHGHRHACSGSCLPQGNWLVIGSAVRTQLLRDVGGWRDEEMYEDWSAWLRCWLHGATVEAIPQAVYRAHIRFDSRNRSPSHAEKERWHRAIYDSCFAEAA